MNELALASPQALTIQQIVDQRELVVSAMKNAMVEGVHYGKIPGCGEKPTLMQPGAQILGHLFRLRPEYEIKEKAGEGEHREYQVIARQFSIGTEMKVGEGVGICSTRESKYRYRNAAKEMKWTDTPVPPIYWTHHKRVKEAPSTEARDIANADRLRWITTAFEGKDPATIGFKKNDQGVYLFVEYHGGEGKVENENIADVFNTVLKMGKKRAYVDSIITATASSDLFTQDLEEIAENLRAVEEVTASPVKAEVIEKNVTPTDEGKAKYSTPVAKPPNSEGGGVKHVTNRAPDSSAVNPAATGVQSWQDVVCHIGKANGPLKDKPLGKLAVSSLEWLGTQMAKKDKPTKQDSILKAALAMWRGSQGGSTELPLQNDLDFLKAKCEAMKIPLSVVATVSRTLGGKSQTFEEIPADEAKHMLDSWEETAQLIKDELDQLPS